MKALISVADKRGLEEFGRGLAALGWSLTASGGTAAALRAAGVEVEPVPGGEWLGGRVKTLQAPVHAAILARRDRPEDLRDLAELQAAPIDLVAVNLYPFRESPEIETIDVGGVALLRGAAKNWAFVAAVCDPSDYGSVLAELRAEGRLSEPTRRALARKAFAHTAAYDAAIARWLGHDPSGFPDELALAWRRVDGLRYGENPHQEAALYREPLPGGPTLLDARALQGKALSYNNWLDAAAAWELAGQFDRPAAAAVKHAGPCGVALGSDPLDAYVKCHDADPVSIYGGIVAVNRRLTADLAREMVKIFLEVVVAPEVDPAAREVFARKKNLRVLEAPAPQPGGCRLRSLPGGVLVQQADRGDDPASWRVVSERRPADLADARFAWTVARFVASNAVVVARGLATAGIGGGQPNRVGAARIALAQAGGKAEGAALASDGFFFPDTVEAAEKAGVTTLVSPGGSLQDAEVIAAADRAGLALVFTGVRHFRH
jgi:phosphoribosylaminoimidazolecarboxamide formyltransferase/IMP cyclohydrolase